MDPPEALEDLEAGLEDLTTMNSGNIFVDKDFTSRGCAL